MIKINTKFLTGVSALALGMTSPLLAQTITTPGLLLDPVATIASGVVDNSGVIDTGVATSTAVVNSVPTGTISQTSVALTPVNGALALNNNGTVGINAAATAANPAGAALANASVTNAISQVITAPDANVAATFTNAASGIVNVGATATATGTTLTGATAMVADALRQDASVGGLGGGTASATFVNNGQFNVTSAATAAGGATAAAQGVEQRVVGLPGSVATFNNTGAVSVGANAVASGAVTTGALADATGYRAFGAPVTLNVANAKTLSVAAVATANGAATAHAKGMQFDAIDAPSATNVLSGAVVNSGALTVSAISTGAAVAPATTIVGGADALGVGFRSAVNNATFTNTGAINVSAVTNGAVASATGVRVLDFVPSPLVPGSSDVFTLVNNGGTITARESVNNGATYRHGLAIDTSGAPNPTLISLQGAGSIYGGIDVAAGDAITVSAGETKLDGVINPGGELQGSLKIASGGSLLLVNQPNLNTAYDGPARVNVDSFTVVSGGKLALQLPTNSSAILAQSAYPTIIANSASLGGTLEVRPASQNGLYANSYTYNGIIHANTALTGTFSSVVNNTGSPLLAFSAGYDAHNVNLTMTRIGFGSVAGLSANEAAAGAGIESVYNPNQTGPFGSLLGNLFQLNAAAYPGALDQLSGSQYAGYVQGLRNYNMQTNGLVSDQIDCAISAHGIDNCRNPTSGGRLWVLGGYNDVRVDSDINAPGYKSKNWFGLLGADFTTGNVTFGGFGGYRGTKTKFDRYNGEIKSEGWQLGLFAAYDVGSLYVRGIGSYSNLKADSKRDLLIGPIGGTLIGKPDADVWSFYGESGVRFNLGASWVTPFVAVDYTDVKLKGFTETGVPGANLTFDKQSAHQVSTLAGLKWAGSFGGIVPEAKVAWRHDFGDQAFGISGAFADAPTGSDFRILSPRTNADSIVAGLSLAAVLSDKVTGRIGYQGRFNKQVADHAVYGSLTLRFGGETPAPAPAPAPVPAAAAPAPLPPCPPAAVTPGPFLVFFDWDKSLITAEASAILDRAAEQYAATGQTSVQLAGHADKSGKDDYNVGLSQRRADAVKAYLATKGVPDGSIMTQAFGESRPLVDTADGVREPQNRRVEITFSGAPVQPTGACAPQ
jgi:outer membrane protein OmpA-like peptidoglycan-associated protein/uncharacterized protein YhjY with autotransporter beta-barrel domain